MDETISVLKMRSDTLADVIWWIKGYNAAKETFQEKIDVDVNVLIVLKNDVDEKMRKMEMPF